MTELYKSIYDALKEDNKPLINRYLRRSPQARMGCESEHVKLLALAATALDKDRILDDILGRCKFDPAFVFSIYLATRDLKSTLEQTYGLLRIANDLRERNAFGPPPLVLAIKYGGDLVRDIGGDPEDIPGRSAVRNAYAYAGSEGDLQLLGDLRKLYFEDDPTKEFYAAAVRGAQAAGNEQVTEEVIKYALDVQELELGGLEDFMDVDKSPTMIEDIKEASEAESIYLNWLYGNVGQK